ncbi:MAG TPA: sugar-binding protein [Frankiaceae bacterium]|nr:sugar-binding protein [Frankiaceae bacterium]
MSEHTDLLPLRGPEEGGPVFDLVRRGYDREQVDSHLAWLEERVQEAEQAREAAEASASQASADADQARDELESGRPSWDALGERISTILNLAEEEGAEIRAARSREADQLLGQARHDAAEAERLHGVRLRDAERQAQEIVRDAQREAEQVVREGQQQALEDERESKRRLTELERQRNTVHEQLATLHQRLAAALQLPTEVDVTDLTRTQG